MKKFLKENWFVVLVALVFIGFSIAFAVNAMSGMLPSKSADGKQVVATVGEENIYADDIYDELYDSYGKAELALMFKDAVVNSCVKDTEAINTQISSTVTQTISYYENYYGYGEDYLNYLAQYYYGYPSFEKYVAASIKTEKMLLTYIEEHQDIYITEEEWEKIQPHMVSYCLIKMDDPTAPTAEEEVALQDAQAAWSTWDKDFAEFAKEYSMDDSTASEGGVFGYVDVNTDNISEAFLAASLELAAGETTAEWVYDESFGYFLIHCDSTDYEDMKEETGLMSSLMVDFTDLANTAIMEKAEAAGYTIKDDETKEYIMEYLGIEHEHTEDESEGE